MSRAYSDIAFTPAVRAMQSRMGSRANYSSFDEDPDRHDRLGAREAEFIAARDGFYQATVSETGWPYVQFRGGPAGFLRVLDERTLGYADFRGNVQYISVGNFAGNDRVSIILMDYANRARLKILGRVRVVGLEEDPALIARLESPHYRTRIERAVVIHIEGYDWNCPQHITPRFTDAEIAAVVAPLHAEIAQLKARLGNAGGDTSAERAAGIPAALGKGPLALEIVTIRQLTRRVRAYELRSPDGAGLPEVRAGAHIDVPVRLAGGTVSTRRYSISSDPRRRDAYEIAVLREEPGSGGSAAVHSGFRVGLALNCAVPGNDFPLHEDARPALLIAGGIGITPIRAMAAQLRAAGRKVELHYAVRSRSEAAYLDELEIEIDQGMHVYAADMRQRLDASALVAGAAPNTVFYVCGPAGLISAVRAAATAAGIDNERVRFERFLAPPATTENRGIALTLKRSGKRLAVTPQQSILEAVEAAGAQAPAGCRTGNCGTCAVKVLAGEPEHRDAALSDVERNQAGLMCICVSRARGVELTLDL